METPSENVDEIEEDLSTGDPSVPPELLEIHVALEETGTTPEEFEKEFGS